MVWRDRCGFRALRRTCIRVARWEVEVEKVSEWSGKEAGEKMRLVREKTLGRVKALRMEEENRDAIVSDLCW